MRIVYPFYFVVLLFSCLNAVGQQRLKFLAFETGIESIRCREVEKDYIRADVTEAYGGNGGLFGSDGALFRRIRNSLSRHYFGVKAEVRTRNNFAGFTGGLRFGQLVGTIVKRNGPPDYFYFRLRQTGTSTEYLKVEMLVQRSNYMSVPLEVRVFAYRQRLFRLFFLAGGEVGYQLSTTNSVTFDNRDMNTHAEAVSEIMGRPDKWYTAFYGRAGFTLGREIPYVTVGITLPVVVSQGSSTLNESNAGIGFHVQVQMPFLR
jgi:hypothetical protein